MEKDNDEGHISFRHLCRGIVDTCSIGWLYRSHNAKQTIGVAKMKKLLLIFVGFVLLAGFIGAHEPASSAHVRWADSIKRTIEGEDAVRSVMLDPAAARFRDVVSPRVGLVCGLVNGKNRFGGYTGEQPFVLRDGIVTFRKKCPSK